MKYIFVSVILSILIFSQFTNAVSVVKYCDSCTGQSCKPNQFYCQYVNIGQCTRFYDNCSKQYSGYILLSNTGNDITYAFYSSSSCSNATSQYVTWKCDTCYGAGQFSCDPEVQYCDSCKNPRSCTAPLNKCTTFRENVCTQWTDVCNNYEVYNIIAQNNGTSMYYTLYSDPTCRTSKGSSTWQCGTCTNGGVFNCNSNGYSLSPSKVIAAVLLMASIILIVGICNNFYDPCLKKPSGYILLNVNSQNVINYALYEDYRCTRNSSRYINWECGACKGAGQFFCNPQVTYCDNCVGPSSTACRNVPKYCTNVYENKCTLFSNVCSEGQNNYAIISQTNQSVAYTLYYDSLCRTRKTSSLWSCNTCSLGGLFNCFNTTKDNSSNSLPKFTASSILVTIPQSELLSFLEGMDGVGFDCSVIPTKFPDIVMVSTTDFFFPLVDDPYYQGKIACANVLSDLYSFGIDTCDNMLMLLAASVDMTPEQRSWSTRLLIKGFNEAGTKVTGGQTVKNPWPIIGGVATSILKRDEFIMPVSAVPGDVLVLTKPIGTQVCVNLHQWIRKPERWQRVESITSVEESERAFQFATRSMARLNRTGARLMKKYGAHAATDVTGFGLLGHSRNLAMNQNASLTFEIHTLPIIAGMKKIEDHLNHPFKLLKGTSAETSGGLLIALPPDQAELFIKEIQEIDKQPAWIIGKVLSSDKPRSENTSIIFDDAKIIEVEPNDNF
eukprot:gene2831-3517_t